MTRQKFVDNFHNLKVNNKLAEELAGLCYSWEKSAMLDDEIPSSIFVPISVDRWEAEELFKLLDLIVTDVSVAKTKKATWSIITIA